MFLIYVKRVDQVKSHLSLLHSVVFLICFILALIHWKNFLLLSLVLSWFHSRLNTFEQTFFRLFHCCSLLLYRILVLNPWNISLIYSFLKYFIPALINWNMIYFAYFSSFLIYFILAFLQWKIVSFTAFCSFLIYLCLAITERCSFTTFYCSLLIYFESKSKSFC